MRFWEIILKIQIGKLNLPSEPAFYHKHLREIGATLLPVDDRHSFELLHLPLLHKDPFDRLLIAQAQVEGFTLVSCDTHFPAYGVPLLW